MRPSYLAFLGTAAILLAVAPLAADEDRVAALLRRARATHEPDAVIRTAVELLDEQLDGAPADAQRWRRLGEALAIGFARSRHAPSALAAYRRAAELEPSNCHTAALVARGELEGSSAPTLADWSARERPCAEMLYLAALRDPKNSVALLERSRAAAPSAEALVALGMAELRRGRLRAAEQAYEQALGAPYLFPEDWRVDGWTAVHANLGLAVIYTRTKRPQRARAARAALREFLDVPGPWHDLSEEERRWGWRTLGERLQ